MARARKRGDPLYGLGSHEGGALLGAVLSGNDGGLFERLGGPWRARCEAAHLALSAQTAQQRRQIASRLSRRLLSPLPDGIEGVHPSWIAWLLDRHHPQVAAAISSLLPDGVRPASSDEILSPSVPPAIRLRVATHVLADLRPMSGASLEAAIGADLIAWQPERLRDACTRFGCLVLLELAQRAGLAAPPQLEHGLPPPFAGWIRQVKAAKLSPLHDRLDKALVQAWQLTAKAGLDDAARNDGQVPAHQRIEHLLLRLGLSAAAASLPAAVAHAVAQRLPRHLGITLREARAFGPRAKLLERLRVADRWATEKQL